MRQGVPLTHNSDAMNDLETPVDVRDDQLSEQVAAWYLRMQEKDCSAEERQAFEAWLAESETYRTEYQQYVALWQDLDQLGEVSKRPSRKKYRAMAVILAALAVTLGSVQWYIGLGETIVTAVGEHRRMVLADGTMLDMNTNSKLRVKITDELRKITLIRGEVQVNVAHDSRPFEVYAGAGRVRDIGTVFDVLRDADKTNVAVLEGEVNISLDGASAVTLHGRQQVAYTADGISPVTPVNPADVGAWLNGRLLFRDTPLADVVKQINRYHTHQVELADAELGSLKVSGEFNSADRDGLLSALKMLLTLRSSEHDGATELSR